MTITSGDGTLGRMGFREAFSVEQDTKTGKWFAIDVREVKPYRLPIPFGSSEMAINFMDRLNAHHEGVPIEDIEELRAEAAALRSQIRP